MLKRTARLRRITASAVNIRDILSMVYFMIYQQEKNARAYSAGSGPNIPVAPYQRVHMYCPVFSVNHREENACALLLLRHLLLYLSIALRRPCQSPWSRMRPARPDHCTRVGIKRLSATEKQKKSPEAARARLLC